jgi:hypothetical protein
MLQGNKSESDAPRPHRRLLEESRLQAQHAVQQAGLRQPPAQPCRRQGCKVAAASHGCSACTAWRRRATVARTASAAGGVQRSTAGILCEHRREAQHTSHCC